MKIEGPGKVLFIACGALASYVLISLVLNLPLFSYPEGPWLHELRVFISFMAVPCLILFALDGAISPLYAGRPEFLLGLSLYLCFIPLILLLFPTNSFLGRRQPLGVLVLALLSLMNVVPVDFFTKRIVQWEIHLKYGHVPAVLLSVAVWILGHYMEIVYLASVGDMASSLLFIAVTGLATALLYQVTKDVSGQMAGHLLINIVFLLLW